MSETFDPAALIDASAQLLGLDLSPESREAVKLHLGLAAGFAARLAEVPLDDEAEPAPVFAP